MMVSPALAAAQAQLLERRAQLQAERPLSPPACPPPAVSEHPPDHSWEMRNALADLQRRRAAYAPAPPRNGAGWEAPIAPPDLPAAPPRPEPAPTVKLWPVLGAALAAAELAPAYRLYIACQSIDPDGRRAFDLAEVRARFTEEGSARYLFSWRRMRQVVAQGRGLLWDVDQNTNRLYLRSIARIAGRVGVATIGRAVLLPVDLLFQGQGAFNAHVHAAWLSAHGDERKPISQAAIEGATAVPARTQRHYNRVARVQRQKNLEIGEKESEERVEEAHWQHGRNAFVFVDAFGYQGAPGGRYCARRLPDSYRRRHRLAANGRRRKINKSLTSLVNHGERGCPVSPVGKRYYANGGEAAKAASRRPGKRVYWSENGRAAGTWRVWRGMDLS